MDLKKYNMTNVLPKEGVLFTKDKKRKLDYEYVNDKEKERVFYFKIYELKSWQGIRRTYFRIEDPSCIMKEQELLNYLYNEGYIDEKH
tara:strand:- start:96 stop:359 length:264 start_codon:yes stop_codon:yes gene_type:complete